MRWNIIIFSTGNNFDQNGGWENFCFSLAKTISMIDELVKNMFNLDNYYYYYYFPIQSNVQEGINCSHLCSYTRTIRLIGKVCTYILAIKIYTPLHT